jgi:hypothetical protein
MKVGEVDPEVSADFVGRETGSSPTQNSNIFSVKRTHTVPPQNDVVCSALGKVEIIVKIVIKLETTFVTVYRSVIFPKMPCLINLLDSFLLLFAFFFFFCSFLELGPLTPSKFTAYF